MKRKKNVMAIVGAISGRSIWRSSRSGPAPSSAAASRISAGIAA